MEIKEYLKKQVCDLTDSQMSMLIWVCGVRALPFMSVRSNFCYWYDSSKKDYINKLFYALALDMRHVFYGIGNPDEARAAYKDVLWVSEDMTRLSQKAYLIGYKSAAAAKKVVKIIADMAIDAFTVSAYLTHTDSIRSQLIEETMAAITKFIDAAEAAKKAVLEAGDDEDDSFGSIRIFEESFNVEGVIAEDIEMIKNNKINGINNDTSMYGELWSGFQTDLIEIGCHDWAEWYSNLFVNHFYIGLNDLEQKLQLTSVAEKRNKMDCESARLTAGGGINKKNKSVFLSYCSADDDIVNIIDDKLLNRFKGEVTISRYKRDVKYRDSFKQFMDSLKNHNFVIAVISAKYLKSRACMYEVSELIALPDFKKRLLFVVLSDDDKKYYELCPTESIAANIYDPVGRNEYILYWKNKYEELYAQRMMIGCAAINKDLEDSIYETKMILDRDIQKFLSYISDARGIPFKELLKTDFKDLADVILMDMIEL